MMNYKKSLLTEAQMKARASGIGGSDVSAILGINPYKTPVDIFMEKTGRSDGNVEWNQRIHFGNVLEDVIAQEYSLRTGNRVRRENSTARKKGANWMIAHIDRKIEGQKKLLECKSADKWTMSNWGESGTDEVPDYYITQPVWYMSVKEYGEADLAALIGGNDFRIYNFERDMDLEKMIVDRVADFWHNNVLADLPPDPVNTSDLGLLYECKSGSKLVASEDIESAVHQLSIMNDVLNNLETDIEKTKFQIKKYMEEHTELTGAGGELIATYRKNKDGKKFLKDEFRKRMPNTYNEFCEDKEGARVLRLKV